MSYYGEYEGEESPVLKELEESNNSVYSAVPDELICRTCCSGDWIYHKEDEYLVCYCTFDGRNNPIYESCSDGWPAIIGCDCHNVQY